MTIAVDMGRKATKTNKQRNASRERESREGVRVEKECEVRRSASKEGMRTKKECEKRRRE